jgi:ABC-type Zn uptake system ZnuABC Zn-binding protein ZnuA
VSKGKGAGRPGLALWMLGILLTAALAGCAPGQAAGPGGTPGTPTTLKPVTLKSGEKLRVVATTAIVGDVVHNVGGDHIDLTTLIGPGQDPHAYEPTPQDVARLEQAQVVFINGLGLEAGLETTVRAAASQGQPIITVSDGVNVIKDGSAVNPHVWLNPENVKGWVRNIDTALSSLDPANAAAYHANAAHYGQQLTDVDTYVQQQTAKIPPDRRKLVTDHEALGYFAAHYGFQVVGVVIPSVSSQAEPSAADLAQIIAKIKAEKVPAVFIGTTANPKMADMVASDTGAKVLSLYSESLGTPGSGADTYLGLMRTDIDNIVRGLAGSAPGATPAQ